MYNFDEIIDRRNTNCGKWDTMDKKFGHKDMIHLGVADMDFRSPQPILDELEKCVKKGVFGYTDLSDSFYNGIIHWLKKRHTVDVKREEIVFCPRINISAGICVEAFSNPEDEVIINTPVYGPLYQAVAKNNRKVIKSPLKIENGRYTIDFEQLENCVSNRTKMFILCSPHNPSGRVWSREDLEKIGEFCLNHGLILFVDEIHCDILADNEQFTSALSLSDEVRKILISAGSPTKTFNIPGLILSYLIIPDENLRKIVASHIDRIGMHNPTVFAMAAMESAYTRCDQWYEEMLSYINENEKFTREYFAKHMPELKIYPREATYLLWIDYSKLRCTEEELESWFLNRANVSVYMGSAFQEEGRGYIRMNIASPRGLLEEAYRRMSLVYSEIKK